MNEELRSSDRRAWWSIHVTGYGRFAYYGTRTEAEQMKRHKAGWEGGRGTMRLATDDEATKERDWLRGQKERGCTLNERETEAIR